MRFVFLRMRTTRLLCQACGVFAAVQIAARRLDGSAVYAVTSTCEICRANYLHATDETDGSASGRPLDSVRLQCRA